MPSDLLLLCIGLRKQCWSKVSIDLEKTGESTYRSVNRRTMRFVLLTHSVFYVSTMNPRYQPGSIKRYLGTTGIFGSNRKFGSYSSNVGINMAA